MVTRAASVLADTSVHSIRRAFLASFPSARSGAGDSTLELAALDESYRLEPPQVLEGDALARRRIWGAPNVGFSAFLDGTQRSSELGYVRTVPIVHGSVGAVIRERRDRRMMTWRHVVRHHLYASRPLLTEGEWTSLADIGLPIVDTSDDEAAGAEHPGALREAALKRVMRERESVECELTRAWVAERGEVLFVDGGISAAMEGAHAAHVVGVVKSHGTLFADSSSLGEVFSVGVGERTTAFLVMPRHRAAVASWYLRLRDAAGHDPLWGLVRVEIASDGTLTGAALGARADEVSRWILVEAAPTAHPDARWDTMVYGIRDCEVFLKAIQ
jgi:hypothetical protein